MRVMVGEGDKAHTVDTKHFLDLAEYIRGRQQRERCVVPVASKKMDISHLGNQSESPGGHHYGYGALGSYDQAAAEPQPLPGNPQRPPADGYGNDSPF